MTNAPLVSFCMSTYKRPQFLKSQLYSLIQQTYSNFEIIISDNDLEQSAKEIAAAFYDNRIKYFANSENYGMIKSFNKSIERSSGEFIIMITDDDPLYIDSLQSLVDLSNKYPNYSVFAGCGDWIIGNENAANSQKMKVGTHSKITSLIPVEEVTIIEKDNFLFEYIAGKLRNSFMLWSCAMVKRETLINIKGVPDYGSEFLGDHAYMIAISSQNGMVYYNKNLGGQLVHGANFGYDFYKVEKKYIVTPNLFYNYLKQALSHLPTWQKNQSVLWNYIGRSWVEYSLMLFHSLKNSKKTKKDFYSAFHQAFANTQIKKWKYKFYLKAYCNSVFKVLLKVKKMMK